MPAIGAWRIGRRIAVVATSVVLVVAATACTDPEEEEPPARGQAPPGTDSAPASEDPGLDVDRFLARLEERTGYEQDGHVEVDGDTTTLWVHVDPEHEDWVHDQIEVADLEGLEVVATQPIGATATPSPDAPRYTTEDIAHFRQAIVDLVVRLSDELAAGEADDPEAHPTSAAVDVVYDTNGDQLTVAVQARFDRLPASAVAELREQIPDDVLDLVLDAQP